MDPANDSRVHLAQTFQRYKELTLPRSWDHLGIGDADIDMFEEDGYLAGLVDTFLTHKLVPVDGVALNRAIDERIQQASDRGSGGELLRNIQLYRNAMLHLAMALSRAANVPLTWRDGSGC